MRRAEPLAIDVQAETLSWQRAGEAVRCVPFHPAQAAAALHELLHDAPASSPAELRVSACHARLFMLPWAELLHTEARWQSLAESRFDELFGDAPERWALRVVPERPGRARLAVALPHELVAGLAEALGPRRHQLRVAALMRLDALRQSHPRFTGALVDEGEQHALIALLVNGQLQRVRLRRATPRDDELRPLLAVEWAALGRDEALPALAWGGVGEGAPDLARRRAWAGDVIGLR